MLYRYTLARHVLLIMVVTNSYQVFTATQQRYSIIRMQAKMVIRKFITFSGYASDATYQSVGT